MNLRYFVVLLLLANLLLWAWSDGVLDRWGLAPSRSAQPPHVVQQVRPEALDVRSLDDVATRLKMPDPGIAAITDPSPSLGAPVTPRGQTARDVDAGPTAADVPLHNDMASTRLASADPVGPDPTSDGRRAERGQSAAQVPEDDAAATAEVGLEWEPTPETATNRSVCWQAGPFDEAQARTLRQAAAELPRGSWQLLKTGGQAPRWMVYLGDIGDELAVLAKRNELHADGLDVDRPGAGFEPGLSLGRYSSQEAAARALQSLRDESGVTGARVVQERVAEATYFLRAESAQPGWRQRLQQLPLAGRNLRRCS